MKNAMRTAPGIYTLFLLAACSFAGPNLFAQLAVDGSSGKYSEFKGHVATVYANPLSHGGASNSHYNGNAETYLDIGEAMGKAMVDLLQDR